MTLRRAGHVVVVGVALAAAACDGDDSTRAVVSAGTGAMAVVSVAGSDTCSPSSTPRVTAVSIWIDGLYDHEVLLFPGTGQTTYDSLIGPLAEGRHDVELRPSAFWKPARCLLAEHVTATAVEPGTTQHELYRHAPVLELRADTVGEQSDIPLYSYAEHVRRDAGWTWRYTVVFSNEDGGTPTRALLARWGRTTDIEQVYEITTVGSRITREEFQGPDHVVHPFQGRRQGDAPILLVATLNNMVTDRGRGVAPVRLVPDTVDLARATRESTMDTRPWVYRVMENELATEGRIKADAPMNDAWPRVAPDPLSHIYLEAELRLDRAVAVAWVQDLNGRRYWSHYLQPELAIDRNGWVRSAVAVGSDPGSSPAEVGWACLAAPGATKGGSCEIEATRAFLLTDAYRPGANLIAPIHFVLEAGDEVGLSAVRAVPPGT